MMVLIESCSVGCSECNFNAKTPHILMQHDTKRTCREHHAMRVREDFCAGGTGSRRPHTLLLRIITVASPTASPRAQPNMQPRILSAITPSLKQLLLLRRTLRSECPQAPTAEPLLKECCKYAYSGVPFRFGAYPFCGSAAAVVTSAGSCASDDAFPTKKGGLECDDNAFRRT